MLQKDVFSHGPQFVLGLPFEHWSKKSAGIYLKYVFINTSHPNDPLSRGEGNGSST